MTLHTSSETRVNCNLCGLDDADIVYEAGVAQASRVVRCRHCGLMYAHPRRIQPDYVDVLEWKVDGALDVNSDHPSLFWNRQRLEKEALQVRDYAGTRHRLRALYPGRGDLVEVGAGLGFLSAAFQEDGWSVTAIEPWAEACLHAERSLGVKRTVANTLEGAGLPDASVDVLVMLHVIEHVPDPLGTLREIHRVLRPGGHVVLETPRVDGTVSRLFGPRDRNLRCDGHIYFFGAPQLARMCRMAGFDVVERQLVGRTLNLGRLGYNVGAILGRPDLGERIDATTRRVGLGGARISLNIRDIQRLLLGRSTVPTGLEASAKGPDADHGQSGRPAA